MLEDIMTKGLTKSIWKTQKLTEGLCLLKGFIVIFVNFRGYTWHAYYLKHPLISRTFFPKIVARTRGLAYLQEKGASGVQFSITSDLKPCY